MFQMIEPSFRAFAKPGHGNIYNPTDEAISAMNTLLLSTVGEALNAQEIMPMRMEVL
ncbi:hypothetical protein CSC47_1372 [Staphylococcus aureus]|nr:hypothetical protein CSC47_1372 [Staphylococcus aureus]